MTAFWAELPYRIYRFSGKDAKSFLQGQITQDIQLIKQGYCQYAAYCNHKGKMFANLLLTCDSDDASVLVSMPAEQSEAVVKRLKMFVMRSDVSIDLADMSVIALNPEMFSTLCQHHSIGELEVFHSVVINQGLLLALPNGYAEMFIPRDMIADYLAAELMNIAAIDLYRTQNGYFTITEKTYELLLPQQTTLAAWGAISYTKGCYVGQEIIARQKYLGKSKNGFATAKTDVISNVNILDPIHCNDKPVGKVIAYHHNDGQGACLALLADEALSQSCQINECSAVFESLMNHPEV